VPAQRRPVYASRRVDDTRENEGTKQHVQAALQRYLTYKQTPKLVDAHRVGRREEIRASSIGRRILNGLRSLRVPWFRTDTKS